MKRTHLDISEVEAANGQYFAPGNRQFFGDISYRVEKAKSGDWFMVRYSNAWSDMFTGVKTPAYYVNSLDQDTLKVGPLVRDQKGLPRAFLNLVDVRVFLQGW